MGTTGNHKRLRATACSRRGKSTTHLQVNSSDRRRLTFESLEDRRLLAVVTVDTELDVVDFNDGVTSLREAIFASGRSSTASARATDGVS